MSHNTWTHLAIRPIVRPLAATPVTPNQLTTLRLASGLAAVWCFAGASPNWGATWLLLSGLLDRADGELARLQGRSSRFGHYYDLAGDFAIDVSIFIAIGIGLSSGPLGMAALVCGVAAALAVASIFLLVNLAADKSRPTGAAHAAVDPDDMMLMIAPIAWLGALEEFLVLAGIGAPLCLMIMLLVLRPRGRRGVSS